MNVREEKTLLNGNWLTDNVINAAQQLVKMAQKHPHVNGLQDAALAYTLGFEVIQEEFVQVLVLVLHTG